MRLAGGDNILYRVLAAFWGGGTGVLLHSLDGIALNLVGSCYAHHEAFEKR